MDEWEYLPTFIKANVKSKDTKAFLKEQLPDVKKPPRYVAESMMPELDELGSQGWELVHMEPVADVGKKGDVLFDGGGRQWSNTYFCVFKRCKAEQVERVAPVYTPGTPAHPRQQSPSVAQPTPPAPQQPSQMGE